MTNWTLETFFLPIPVKQSGRSLSVDSLRKTSFISLRFLLQMDRLVSAVLRINSNEIIRAMFTSQLAIVYFLLLGLAFYV